MKNLKKVATTMALTGIIIIGVTSAKAGILVGLTDSDTRQECTQQIESKVDNGILVGFTGILVGFTGILVGFNETPKECGFIMTD